MIRNLIAAALLVLASAGPARESPRPGTPQATQAPRVFDARIVATYPHDETAFTEGLLWHDGALYESTGREGQSEIRKTELATGKVLLRRAIPADQFGEGLAIWRKQLVSLTWRNGAIHRWRVTDLGHIRTDDGYPYEGWGLARLGKALIASDGSSELRVLDPDDYHVLRTISVTMRGRPLRMLNELEVVDGLVLANVWMTNFIVAIDPANGSVRQVIDLSNLPTPPGGDRDAVLNGIAWDPESRRLFVTGKLWPRLYEIQLVERVRDVEK